MDLNKPLPLLPSSKGILKVVKSYPATIQHRSSDLSNPGLTSDSGSSGSEFSIEEYTSTDQGADIWDSYWAPAVNQTTQRSCLDLNIPSLLQVDIETSPRSKIFHTESQNLCPKNRNYGSADLPKLNTAPISPISPTSLHRSTAVQISPHRRASQPDQTRPSYSPFPTIRPSPPHNSWSLPGANPTRPRAQTTPSNFQAHPPSNFSTCTTLEYVSPSPSSYPSSEGSPLYMSSNSLEPLFSHIPPMDLSSPTPEKNNPVSHVEDVSFFEDDDDEEEEVSAKMKVLKMLHIRSGSADLEESEGLQKEREKENKGGNLKRLRKSLGERVGDANESLKAVFRSRGEK